MREAKYTVSGSRLTEQMKLKDVRAAELAVDTGILPGGRDFVGIISN